MGTFLYKRIKTIYLKCVYFIICKLYTNEDDVRQKFKRNKEKNPTKLGLEMMLINSVVCSGAFVITPEQSSTSIPGTDLQTTLAKPGLNVSLQ